MNVQLVVEHIRCDQTTEMGHDEVYVLIGGAVYDANNAPTPVKVRAPDPSEGADADPKGPNGEYTAWDCNDSGQMQDKRPNAVVFTVDVPDGGHVVLGVNVMESDGTNLGDQIAGGINLAGEIVKYIPGWGATAASVASGIADKIKSLIPNNQDDHLGAITYSFANLGGKVVVTDAVYSSGAATLSQSSAGVTPYRNKVQFKGDGSDYKIDFRIDGARAKRLYNSFRSVNYSNRYIRHSAFLGELTPIVNDLDRADATFEIVPGLADPSGVSFASVNYPNYYLRHQDFRIKLNKRDGNALFDADATFHRVPGLIGGLGGLTASSFRSHNYPDRYIRHRDFHLYLEGSSGPQDTLFGQDASFRAIAPFAPGSDI
jgi:hypothetical protein